MSKGQTPSTQTGPKASTSKEGPLRKNRIVQSRVVARAIQGKSQRQIAKEVVVDRKTVKRILSRHEVEMKRAEAKTILLDRAPKMALKLTDIALKGKGDRQALTDALRGIQVLTPREDHAFVPPAEGTGHTVAEALFYIKFKRFPKDMGELAEFERENPVPAEIPPEWEE